MRKFLTVTAIVVAIGAGCVADLALAQPATPAAPASDATQPNAAQNQLYFPPPNGAPSGRVSGGTRGIHPLTTTANSTATGNPPAAASSTTAKPQGGRPVANAPGTATQPGR